jgi:hypothetical protein
VPGAIKKLEVHASEILNAFVVAPKSFGDGRRSETKNQNTQTQKYG